MSSAAICQNFVQNAWKKELCSNCFKSKDEHVAKPKLKPIQFDSKKKIASIIKLNSNNKRTKPKRQVCFPNDLIEIIGVGGEDWLSDENDEHGDDDCDGDNEDNDDDFTIESDDDDDDEDVAKEIKRITKENTDFNMTSLGDVIEVKKTYTQLLLGKPVMDANGKKQTLMVSVTPFGEDSTKKYNNNTISTKNHNKEMLAETKSTNVVLTSYTKNIGDDNNNKEKSLLDEISETLEMSKNPIQIISRKKAQKEIVLNVNNKENIEEKTVTKTEKRVSLTRTPALKRDQEKPVIFQTSTAKIELLNNKNSKLNSNKPVVAINNKELTTKFLENEIKNQVILRKVTERVTGLPPQVPKYQTFPQTREQAGEPDGRADPEGTSLELPALPLTPPPPLENQSSFLHSPSVPVIYEKPKIPSKPSTVLIRKSNANFVVAPSPIQTLSTFAPSDKTVLTKQDSYDSDCNRGGNKRRAPRPPEETIYSSRPLPVEEKCSKNISSNPHGEISDDLPEPAPRKSLSISTDSLTNVGSDEKCPKTKQKGRFSLKKFLRMGGGNKETIKQEIVPDEFHQNHPVIPQPKPRLVIVHPTELTGTQIEVVKKPEKVTKPPPPPRHYDDVAQTPQLPHPPKSKEILNKQRQISRSNSVITKQQQQQQETVYANIGEVRSSIVPNKPQRTASMREREAAQQKLHRSENLYDYIHHSGRSSSPDSDSSRDVIVSSKILRLNKRSESSIDVSGDYYNNIKFNPNHNSNNSSNIPRSMSLTYCGSETESEIYSPYSFYGSESEVTEDDHDWVQNNGRTHKLRSRKGRSIVHKNLEDNYGAVVVANHEALAQVLENIQQTIHIQPALRGLKMSVNLRWTDFSLKSGCRPVIIGSRVFHQALWGAQHVTLVVNAGTTGNSSTLSLGTFTMTPVTEFSDLISSSYTAENSGDEEQKLIHATIGVLPWLQVNTIQSFGEQLRLKMLTDNHQQDVLKDASFVMLQLVNALKTLQAQGIEELPLSLNSFVLCKEMERENHNRLCVLQGLASELADKTDQQYGSLCMCASKALNMLQPKTTSLIQSLLSNERAVSLTQVKSILEFTLWGPSDVALGSTIRERELALQRWLDLQRATVLHGLVCTRVQLTVYEECHLLFLVRSNARMMCDASLLIESSNMKAPAVGTK